MKFAIAGLVAASALLLAGCSGSSDDDNSAAPSATPTVAAQGDTSTPQPSVGNLDDPLCAAAAQNIDDSASLQSKTGDLTTMLQDPSFLTSGDATALNQWGDDMLTLTGSTKAFYELGVEQTKGDPVNADFVTLSGFVDDYSTALAQAAADAESPKAFMTTIQTLFSDGDVTAASQAAPAAAQNVAAYLGTRCDLTS